MSHRSQPAQILRPAHNASRGVHPRGPEPRSGLTLIEMLVALAVTLVMMAAVVNLFANISGSIRNRRAVIEVTGQLRQVRQQLALDLAGATCKGRTWQRAEHNPGYIEIIEGPASDAFPSILVDGVLPETTANPEIDYRTSQIPSGGDAMTNLADPAKFPAPAVPLTARPPEIGDVTNGRALGDWDDILALTVQSEANPFRVQVGNNMVESNYAEVVWFAAENNPSFGPVNPPQVEGMRRIYRRVFIIDPRLGPWNYDAGAADLGRPANVSVHFVPGATANTGQWVANHLSDLTRRENRIARNAVFNLATDFPFLLNRNLLFEPAGAMRSYLVLDDALAFDVRVYDPTAPLRRNPAAPASGPDVAYTVLQPGDPYWAAVPATRPIVGAGAYVDLAYNNEPSWKTGPPLPTTPPPLTSTFSGLPSAWGGRTLHDLTTPWNSKSAYDTWSFHYENDRIDHDGVFGVDQATNDFDDDNINGKNDPGERETSPPYDVPLRGVKVSLRIYERDARQIRESSVTHAFTQ